VLGRDELNEAAGLLAAGSLVAIPTDTVYGLAALLADAGAVEALFEVKRRPGTAPIAVLCADVTDATAIAVTWPAPAQRLAARYWPGPLTIVVDADPALTERLGAARGVGLRVPADALCVALLGLTGPLAVTSANLHGASPATCAEDLIATFDGRGVAAVLDGGRRDSGISTVVDLCGQEATVVREGVIAAGEALAVATRG
jgi:tRNA threonylcarbamoyl adenosine modification protein (Sua5/YciO/YrdC/YwlC family)